MTQAGKCSAELAGCCLHHRRSSMQLQTASGRLPFKSSHLAGHGGGLDRLGIEIADLFVEIRDLEFQNGGVERLADLLVVQHELAQAVPVGWVESAPELSLAEAAIRVLHRP